MGKKALSSKTCDGVPEFITMTNLPRRAMAHSKAPELLYGKTHRLAQTAEDIKEADARRRFGTTGKAAVKL